MNRYYYFIIGCFLQFAVLGQVSKVKYLLKYNDTLQSMDAYLIIEDGSATKPFHRLQTVGNLGLVMPANSRATILANYQDVIWTKKDSVNGPSVTKDLSYHSFVPILNEDSYYKRLVKGDTIRLFSLKLLLGNGCINDVRLFENGQDPYAIANGMENKNFVNIIQFDDSNTPKTISNANFASFTSLGDTILCPSSQNIDYALQTPNGMNGLWYILSSNTSITLNSPNNGNTNLIITPRDEGSTIVAAFKSEGKTYIRCIFIQPLKPNSLQSQICVGDTTRITTSDIGSWTSNNGSIATISDSGKITAVSPGTTTFTFTSNEGCISRTSLPLEVMSTITASIIGDSTTCSFGDAVSLYATSNIGNQYMWSDGRTVQSIGHDAGVSTTYTVTITSSGGCSASASINITSYPSPEISLSTDKICIGNTLSAFSNKNVGSWDSYFNQVASIHPKTGLITGLDKGYTFISYLDSLTDCRSEPVQLDILERVAVSVEKDTLCISQTTILSPNTGTWISIDPLIANVVGNNITAVSSGVARFVYSNPNGACSSDTLRIYVRPNPVISITGPISICVGGVIQLSPSSGGFWTFNCPSIITINNNGQAIGISPGQCQVTYTDAITGCISDPPLVINVNALPVVSLSSNSTCVGIQRTASANTGGTWASNNTSVATINATTGVITPVSQGQVTFTFTSTSTGCSKTTNVLIVNPPPTVSISKDTVCVGGTVTLSPVLGGTWAAMNAGVASVSPGGIATGISPGTARFRYTETSTGCQAFDTLVVRNGVTGSVLGLSTICVGSTAQLLPSTGGSWISSNPTIATANSAGLVTAGVVGTALFTFIESGSGCLSNPVTITILNSIPTSILGAQDLCIGGTTTLLPNSGGIWTSTNSSIATVTPNGIVTGVSNGVSAFNFVSNNGCPSSPITSITVNGIKEALVFNGPSTICPGGMTQLNSIRTKYLVLDNNIIDGVTENGLINGIAPGIARVTLDPSSGCTSDTVEIMVVNPPSPWILFQNGKVIFNQDSVNVTIFEVMEEAVTITVRPLVNPNLLGQKNHTFQTMGTINDVLVNISNQAQLAQYIVKANKQNQQCYFNDTLNVWVRPRMDGHFVTFKAFADNNNDNIFNGSDQALSGVKVRIENLNLTQITNNDGVVVFTVDTSGSQYSANINYGSWQDSSLMGIINLSDLDQTIFLAYNKKDLPTKAITSYATNILRCSSTIKSQASLTNTGNASFSGKYILRYNSRVGLVSSTSSFTRINDQEVHWIVPTINTGQKWFTDLTLSIPMAMSNNDSLSFTVLFITDQGDTLAMSNFTDVIRCSYDPNDKRSWPDRVGEDNLTLREETLKYQIRFQNTGNDTAFVVRLQDVLDKHLDLNTLIITNASHDMRIEIYGDTVQFVFDNIKLVDSTTNPLLSQGFVSFQIDEYRNIPNGTEIFNQVNIYFDKNDPIITNRVRNTIVNELPCPIDAIWIEGDTIKVNDGNVSYTWYDCVGDTILAETNEPYYIASRPGVYTCEIKGYYCTTRTDCILLGATNNNANPSISVSPNPAHNLLSIKSDQLMKSISILTIEGSLIFQSNQIGYETDIQIENLKPNIYFVSIVSEHGIIMKKFLKL